VGSVGLGEPPTEEHLKGRARVPVRALLKSQLRQEVNQQHQKTSRHQGDPRRQIADVVPEEGPPAAAAEVATPSIYSWAMQVFVVEAQAVEVLPEPRPHPPTPPNLNQDLRLARQRRERQTQIRKECYVIIAT